MDKMNQSIGKSDTREEIIRLEENWRALLEVLPEMVFLIRDDMVIEFMNTYAIAKLGDLCGKYCFTTLCNKNNQCEMYCPVKLAISGRRSSYRLYETKIDDVDVECSFVPFHGYSGKRLVMLIMKDISGRKRTERDLARVNEKVEEFLRIKINDLKESEKVRRHLSQEVNVLTEKFKKNDATDKMIGCSPKLQKLKDMIHQVADSEATILITGESGTGKELVANLIRHCSRRADKPFLNVNCSTINDNLLESDLFGYEKGAFTGAYARKKGKFEIVDGGTIFLDEIGNISPRMQSSLLRVLQNGEFVRVGGNHPVTVDVRIVAATNADLAQAVQEGRFRLDLYYRLNIIHIQIPPLRERKEDIVDLSSFFVERFRKAFGKDVEFLSDKVIDLFLKHDWPGNIRELENVIQRAVLMTKTQAISENEIFFDDSDSLVTSDIYFTKLIDKLQEMSFKELMGEVESDIILHSLRSLGSVQQVAKYLRIGKTALYDKIKRFDLPMKSK